MGKTLITIIVIGLLLSGCALSESLKITDTEEKNPINNELTPPETPKNNKLDLSNQNLEKIPESVFSQKNLQELDVSGNRLTGAIQAEIRHLKNLKTLKASDNLMTGIPAEIGQLQNLQILDLSNNKLTGLPYELGNLKNLKTLDISGNDFSTLDLNIIIEKLPAGVNIIK